MRDNGEGNVAVMYETDKRLVGFGGVSGKMVVVVLEWVVDGGWWGRWKICSVRERERCQVKISKKIK